MRIGRLLSLSVVLAGLTPVSAIAGPANQTCESATVLKFPSAIVDTTNGTQGATSVSGCGQGDDAAAWFRFVAPEEGRYTFATRATPHGLSDTTLALYKSCQARSFVCIDDTFDSLMASTYVDLNAGAETWIRVAGWGAVTGEFQLVVNHPPDLARPPNDECANAIPLTMGVPVQTTTLFSTGTDSSSCGSEDSSDIWYTFTAPRADDFEFFITQNLISATLLSVQTSCGSGELACGLGRATAHLEPGQKIYLRVGTSPNAADTFNINVGPVRADPPPPNDDYLHAIPIAAPGTYVGTTRGATEDAMNYGPVCGPFVNAAVWYSFTAPATGDYVFDTDRSVMDDTVLAVFGPRASGGSPTGVAPPPSANRTPRAVRSCRSTSACSTACRTSPTTGGRSTCPGTAGA